MRGADRGTALIETLFLSLVLLIPLVWLLGVLADVHRSALALTAAVREAGVDAAASADMGTASDAIASAVAAALRDHGVSPADARIRWSAPRRLARGSAVQVDVSLKVPVLQAPFLGEAGGPGVWVTARHLARVDPFGSAP